MDRRTADLLVGGTLAGLLVVGGVLTWQALQQRSASRTMGSMMDGGSTMHGPDPLLYVFGTLFAVSLLGGGYLFYRDSTADAGGNQRDLPPGRAFDQVDTAPGDGSEPPTHERPPIDPGEPTDGQPVGQPAADPDRQAQSETIEDRVSQESGSVPTDRLLEVLPEDERRILQPVVESPGITQIALRDRSDFSKSKVSQTVSDLEKRGLLYREKQGRTYRVFPSDDLGRQHER